MDARAEPPSLDLERSFWRQGLSAVAGVDEVGRGSWAGPLVAAAVILPRNSVKGARTLRGVRDSKLLAPATREQLFCTILDCSVTVAIGSVEHVEIDRIGIAQANRRAMLSAVEQLAVPPEALIIDFIPLSECSLPQLCLPRAEERSL